MLMVQVKLVRNEGLTRAETVCWLPVDPRLKVGTKLTLKGETKWWEVAELWSTRERTQINHHWEVGGCCEREW